MVTKEQVIEVQEKWGNGVVKIGSLKDNRTECEAFASNFLKIYTNLIKSQQISASNGNSRRMQIKFHQRKKNSSF